MYCNRKRETHTTASAVGSQRIVNDVCQLRKFHDLVPAFTDLFPGHSGDQSSDLQIFFACEFTMKSGPKIQQGSYSTERADTPFLRQSNRPKQLKKRRLAGAVMAEHPKRFTSRQLKTDFSQGPVTFGLILFRETVQGSLH